MTRRSSEDVFVGVLLFAFIPLVLVLFLRQPLGPGWSVALGLAVMFGHRFVAAPWAFRRAHARCAWCGRQVVAPAPPRFAVRSGGREWMLTACDAHHANLAGRFLSFLVRWRLAIAIGIFPSLLLLLGGTLALAAGHPFLPTDALTFQFRVIVAATVISASLAYRLVPTPDAVLRSPFPVHNLLLLGIRQTLWVFRLVGTWWLVAGALG